MLVGNREASKDAYDSMARWAGATAVRAASMKLLPRAPHPTGPVRPSQYCGAIPFALSRDNYAILVRFGGHCVELSELP
jgi:hypothetical protein